MIDALGFAAYMVTNVLPYTIRELVAIAIEYPGLVAVSLFVLWAIYIVVRVALHYGRILALIGAGYVVAVVLQRYLSKS
jgi:hypothetical protein